MNKIIDIAGSVFAWSLLIPFFTMIVDGYFWIFNDINLTGIQWNEAKILLSFAFVIFALLLTLAKVQSQGGIK